MAVGICLFQEIDIRHKYASASVCRRGICGLYIHRHHQRISRHMISPAQCRAARAWLGLDQRDLARLSGCHSDTLRRFENEKHQLRQDTLAKVRSALEARGITFTFSRDGEPLGIEQIRSRPEKVSA